MKRTLLLIAGFLLLAMAGKTQNDIRNVVNDTATYPYWIEMMQNPDANFFQTQRAFNIYWKDRKITRGSGWKVFKRWEYMMQSRVNPDGSRPSPDATFKAYEEYERNSRSSAGSWVNLGPAQIPAPGPAGYEGLGRLNVVAFHPTDPNKLYVGAPSGGMWQTTDGGLTWITHTDTMPTLGVSAIVVDFSNPQKILIGTGDRDAGDAPGLGIFKSLDGGLTWSPSKTGMDNKTIGKIIQHPTNSQIFIAATSGGIYRSVDGGTSWANTKTGNFKDIHFKPNDPNIVYAAAESDFYRSSNNGTTFTKITTGLTAGQRGVIAVTPANPDYVYFLQSDNSSGFKGLYRSTDAGMTFSTRSTTPNIMDWSCDGGGTGGQSWYDLALAADPVNPEIIFAGGVNVWKSSNGGTSWTINSHWYGGCNVPAVHADCHFLVYSPVNGNLYAANDGGCYVSSNNGTTWTDKTVGMTIGQIYKLGQSQTVKNKVINGFQDNGSYTLTPTGWLATGGGDGMECAIDYENAAFTYHTIYYGDIFRKINNGGEYQIAGDGVNGITEGGGWVTPFCLSKADRKGMFVGFKNIWRSSNVINSPVSWTKISDNLANSNSADMADVEHSKANTNIFYAARSDNKFFRSDNCLSANPEWLNLTSSLPASGTATDIAAHPTDENIVYLTLAKKVYKSVNKGQTWTNITGNLPSVNMNAIVYYRNAEEGLYVGTDAGVYYMDATTSGWLPFSLGLPANGRITELDIYYDNDSVSQDAIRASTYGRGLWGSDMYHTMPQADFITANTNIPTNCPIGFTDLSTGVPTFFQWSFQGATPSSSNLKNPENIVYPTPGTYQVKLKVWNEFGVDSLTKTNYITVSNTLLPVAQFSADKLVVCSSEFVHFTDQTANCPIAWTWEFTPSNVIFLENTSASSQNPVVKFTSVGIYSVKLTATNGAGQSFVSYTDYIRQGGYSLPFSESFADGFETRHWQVKNPDLSITWDTITVGGISPGTKAVWMNFFNYNAITRRDQLISPVIDLTDYTTVSLSFRHAYEQRVRKDSLIIYVSGDCGATWQRIWGMGPNGTPDVFVTHPSTNTAFYPQSSDDWCGGSYGVGCYTIDLSPYAGMSDVKLMFESYNYYGNNLFLTDIMVSGPVGVKENSQTESALKVSPNPSDGIFKVSMTNSPGDVNLAVSDITGKIIYSENFSNQKVNFSKQLDLSKVNKGMYFVRVTTGTGIKAAKFVIK
ncbi:MAG: PKD domain-containing protein [Bacteroidota bacterium]